MIEMTFPWNTFVLARRIALRAANLHTDPYTYATVFLDLATAHLNGCPLMLAALLAATDGELRKELDEIHANIDYVTGLLRPDYTPKFAVSRKEPAE